MSILRLYICQIAQVNTCSAAICDLVILLNFAIPATDYMWPSAEGLAITGRYVKGHSSKETKKTGIYTYTSQYDYQPVVHSVIHVFNHLIKSLSQPVIEQM